MPPAPWLTSLIPPQKAFFLLRNKVQCQNEVTACSHFTLSMWGFLQMVTFEVLQYHLQLEVKMGHRSKPNLYKITFVNNSDLSWILLWLSFHKRNRFRQGCTVVSFLFFFLFCFFFLFKAAASQMINTDLVIFSPKQQFNSMRIMK